MGASVDLRTYKFTTIEDIKRQWKDDVDDSLDANGYEYSGRIGMLGRGFSLSEKIAGSEEEAEEYIVDNHRKWNDAMAVRYFSSGALTKAQLKKIDAINKTINSMAEKKSETMNSIQEAFDKRKALLVTCKVCKSKINKSYTVKRNHDIICPCCKDSFLSDTDLKRLQRIDIKIRDLVNKKDAIKPQQKTGASPDSIMIGGWCSC